EAGGDGRLAAFWRGSARSLRPRPAATPRFDFRVGLPDRSLLPLQVWRRVTARALRTLSKSPTAYAEPEGRHVLRDAISKHVSFARLVACQADDVVVTAGAQQAFDLIARILVTPRAIRRCGRLSLRPARSWLPSPSTRKALSWINCHLRHASSA